MQGCVTEVRQSVKKGKCEKYEKECEISVMGCIPLFYNRIMTIGSRYHCCILCLLAIWVCILVAS